jgi:hypothetical protein
MRLRLVPRTLTGRLALVVVTVLVIAQLLSLAIHMHERGELLMQASGMRAAQQIADIADLFESVGATERRRIAQVLSRPPLSVTLDRAPIPKAEVGTRAAMFETMLRRRLGDARVLATRITENGVVAQFPLGKGTQWKGQAQPDGYPTGPSMRSGHVEGSGGMRGPGMNYLATPGVVLLAQVRLRDGSVVTFESGQPAQTLHWSYRILGTLAWPWSPCAGPRARSQPFPVLRRNSGAMFTARPCPNPARRKSCVRHGPSIRCRRSSSTIFEAAINSLRPCRMT